MNKDLPDWLGNVAGGTVILGIVALIGVASYTPKSVREAESSSIYYSNCSEAEEYGVSSIEEDEAGYRSELDRDGDGTACEPYNP